MNSLVLHQFILADAYGAGTYSCDKYNTNEGCDTTTGVQAPDTGFFTQPAYVLYPTLLGIAVVIGTLTFIITRYIKKSHK